MVHLKPMSGLSLRVMIERARSICSMVSNGFSASTSISEVQPSSIASRVSRSNRPARLVLY